MTFLKKIKQNVFDQYVEILNDQGIFRRHQEFLSLPEHEVKKDGVYQKVSTQIVETLKKAQFDFAKYSEIDFGKINRSVADDILALLMDEGVIVKITDDVYTMKELIDQAQKVIQEKLSRSVVFFILSGSASTHPLLISLFLILEILIATLCPA